MREVESCFPLHFRERCLQIHTNYVMHLRRYPEPETRNVFRATGNVDHALTSAEREAIEAWTHHSCLWHHPSASVDYTSTPGAITNMGHPVAMWISSQLTEYASQMFSAPLHLSYSSLVLFRSGVPLIPHRDQNSNSRYFLGYYPVLVGCAEWPLYVHQPETDVVDLFPTRSDRIDLFAGHDVWHWRTPYPGAWAVGVYTRLAADPAMCRFSPEECELMAHMGHRALFGGAPVNPAGFPVAKLYSWVRSPAQEWIDAGAPQLAGDMNGGTRVSCEECDRLRALHGEQWREARVRTGAGESRRSP